MSMIISNEQWREFCKYGSKLRENRLDAMFIGDVDTATEYALQIKVYDDLFDILVLGGSDD